MKCFLIFSLAVLMQLAAMADQYGIVTGDRVNIREGYSTASPVVGQLLKDQKVIAVEQCQLDPVPRGEPASWIIIRMEGSETWVKSSYLDKDNKVTSPNLNLRVGPGADRGLKGKLTLGEVVVPLETRDGWTRIENKKDLGFVAAQYIKLTGEKVDLSTAAKQTKVEAMSEATPAPKSMVADVKVESAETKAAPVPPVVQPEPEPEIEEVELKEIEIKPIPPALPPTEAEPVAAPVPVPAAPAPTAPMAPVSEQNLGLPTTVVTVEPGDRVVRREGVVRPNGSPAAPSPYSLYNLQYRRRMMNFLFVPSTLEGVSLKEYSGKKVIITGREVIDVRWVNKPLLVIDTIELLNPVPAVPKEANE